MCGCVKYVCVCVCAECIGVSGHLATLQTCNNTKALTGTQIMAYYFIIVGYVCSAGQKLLTSPIAVGVQCVHVSIYEFQKKKPRSRVVLRVRAVSA